MGHGQLSSRAVASFCRMLSCVACFAQVLRICCCSSWIRAPGSSRYPIGIQRIAAFSSALADQTIQQGPPSTLKRLSERRTRGHRSHSRQPGCQRGLWRCE